MTSWIERIRNKDSKDNFFSDKAKELEKENNQKKEEPSKKDVIIIENGELKKEIKETKNDKDKEICHKQEKFDINKCRTYHVIFKGKVQGVSFRYTTKEQAEKYGVYGTAENLKDGSVECYFYGRMRDISAVINYMISGSESQNVEEMTFKKISNKKFKKFEVKHDYPTYSGYSGGYSNYLFDNDFYKQIDKPQNKQTGFKDFFGYNYALEENKPKKESDVEFWDNYKKECEKLVKDNIQEENFETQDLYEDDGFSASNRKNRSFSFWDYE